MNRLGDGAEVSDGTDVTEVDDGVGARGSTGGPGWLMAQVAGGPEWPTGRSGRRARVAGRPGWLMAQVAGGPEWPAGRSGRRARVAGRPGWLMAQVADWPGWP